MKNYKMPKLDIFEMEAKYAFAAVSGLEDHAELEISKEDSGDIVFG